MVATSPDTPAKNPTRELAAIMFSDVVGYTAIMGRDEREGVRAIAEHRANLRSLLPRFNGRLIGEIGDGTLSSFHSAVDAVKCARELQATLVEDPQLRLRIGIHVGDVLFTDNTALGDGVNIASRIHALAPPGGICISERVYDEIRNKPEIEVKDLGEKNLKNVSRPIRVYSLQVAATVDRDSSSPLLASQRKTLAVIAVISAVALAIVVAYASRSRILTALKTPASIPRKVTIAVLPFANLSNDKNDEYFSDGMTDEIIGDLSKITNLQVAARTSSFAFKGQNQDASKVASLLHVRNLIEGSVRRSNGKVRIEVELIDAVSGFSIWSERYDRAMADIFAIQSDVAESVAAKLKVSLLPSERARVERKPTDSLEAYNLYLQGNYYFRQFTEDGVNKARQYFNLAIEKDPNFALAYAVLAATYGWAADLSFPAREAMPKVKTLAEHALAIDNTLAEAHVSLACFYRLQYVWDWKGAEREFKIGLELDPNSAGLHECYGLLLNWTSKRFSEALAQSERARELDPLWVQHVVDIGDVYFFARQYDRALEYYNEAIAMAPDFYNGYVSRANVLAIQGHSAEAVADAEKSVSLTGDPLTRAFLAATYGAAGRKTDALKILDQLKEESKHRYVSTFGFFLASLGAGETDRAFQYLEQAYQERSAFIAGLRSPAFDPLRSDPRFQAMYKKAGLPE